MAHSPIYSRFLHVPEFSYTSRGSSTSNRELGADELAAILEELQPKSNTPLPLSQRYQSLHSVSWHPYIISSSLTSRASESSSSDLSCPSSSSLAPSLAPSESSNLFFRRWGNQRAKKSAKNVVPLTKSAIRRLSPSLLVHIAEHLLPSTNDPSAQGDVNDLLNTSLVCRDLYTACRKVLYQRLEFGLNDIEIFKKQILSKKGTKLELLIRSLRNNKELGPLVRHIRGNGSILEDGVGLSQASEYALIDLFGQCSNVETVIGLPMPCIDNQSELYRTMSALTSLRQLQCIGQTQLMASEYDAPLSPFSGLQTLIILKPDFKAGSEASRFSMQVRRLPAIKHLLLKDFPSAFKDSHFRMLPLQKLHALRLENMEGLTDDGFDAAFSGLNNSSALVDLTLIDSGISSTSAIDAILKNTIKIRRLTILAEFISAPLQGSSKDLLCSKTLRQFHWQIQGPHSSDEAFELLAASISTNRFPSLLTVRAPFDGSGIIQAVCRPLAPPAMSSRVQPSGNQVPKSSVEMTMAYSRRAAMARAAKALAPFRRRWTDANGGEWDIIQNLGEGRFFSEQNFDTQTPSLGYIRITVNDEHGRIVTMSDRPKFLGRVLPRRNIPAATTPDYILVGDGQNDTAICNVDTWIWRRLL